MTTLVFVHFGVVVVDIVVVVAVVHVVVLTLFVVTDHDIFSCHQ